MEKVRRKIELCWQGGVHKFYRHSTSDDQALRYAIRQLAREVGYTTKYVQNHIMDTNHRRWEVTK